MHGFISQSSAHGEYTGQYNFCRAEKLTGNPGRFDGRSFFAVIKFRETSMWVHLL